jgi:hypothetical protein
MPQLRHSKVYRGGATAPSLSYETSQCSASVDQLDGTLDIRFDLASKGGGTTCVLLQIGKGDFQAMLQEIASKLPESVGVLSDCASIANKKNLELLQSARTVHDNERARAKSLIEDLEAVEEFVSEKFYEAPVGQDDKEEKARDQLQKVISSLRELR